MPTARMPSAPSGVLTVELVPRTCWFSNLRTVLRPGEWTKCKQFVRQRSGDRCEVCGGRGEKWPVECHEVWRYDETTYTQILDGLVALCPRCHEVKHIGFAETRDRLPAAIQQLANVNGWTEPQVEQYLQSCFRTFERRSQIEWELDVSWIATLGITMPTLVRIP